MYVHLHFGLHLKDHQNIHEWPSFAIELLILPGKITARVTYGKVVISSFYTMGAFPFVTLRIYQIVCSFRYLFYQQFKL